jgi:hypothetical protein
MILLRIFSNQEELKLETKLSNFRNTRKQTGKFNNHTKFKKKVKGGPPCKRIRSC